MCIAQVLNWKYMLEVLFRETSENKKKKLLRFFYRVTCIEQCTLVISLNLLKKNWYIHIFLKMGSDKICQCSGEC